MRAKLTGCFFEKRKNKPLRMYAINTEYIHVFNLDFNMIASLLRILLQVELYLFFLFSVYHNSSLLLYTNKFVKKTGLCLSVI